MKTVLRQDQMDQATALPVRRRTMSTLWLTLKVFAIVALGLVGVIGIQI
jgi:nitrate reductase NapE component